jgi:hypothetical protein
MALTKAEKVKDARLKREFHVTLEEVNRVLKLQGGRCAGCKRLATEFKNGLAVDHDHKTGQVRGLLCWLCNKALGKLNDATDSVDKLKALAAYLENPPFTVVLGKPRYTVPGRVGTKIRRKKLAAFKEAS